MKGTTMIIASFLLSLAAFAQQKPLTEIVDVKLPDNAKKISKSQAELSIAPITKDKNSLESRRKLLTGEFFDIPGTTLFQINAYEKKMNKNYLEENKKVFDAMWGHYRPGDYQSFIKDLPGFKVHIMTYSMQNSSYYQFFALSNSLQAGLNGSIEFQEADRGKVLLMMDDFFKSMRLKK